MVKIPTTVVLFFIILALSSCSKKEHQTQTDQGEVKSPTTIQDNRSLVQVKILSIYKKNDEDYSLKLRLITCEDIGSLPSMAAAGDEIMVSPNFYLDERGKINSADQRNQKLKSLSNKREGDTVNLILKLTLKMGWLIMDMQQ
ncbi:MAG: hypothetical protein FJ213_09610 [Ignavibacteria bacterium]|nr:hypothetical protein [Ignavibacteria bacterium]MBM4176410.1 hypothetical protein [Ignavibacteria bacterium]